MKTKPKVKPKNYVGRKAYLLALQYVQVEILEYNPSFGRNRYTVKLPDGTKQKVEKLLFTKPTPSHGKRKGK